MRAPMDEIVRALWGIVTALLAVVWVMLTGRIKKLEERIDAHDMSILYLRDEGHKIRNLIPNPMDVENRRREQRETIAEIFKMLREIEKQQAEIMGELRLRSRGDARRGD